MSKAWQDFLSGSPQVDQLRPSIIASWQRCLEYGLNPQRSTPPRVESEPDLEERWRAHPCSQLLTQVIKELSVLADGSGHLVVVTDGQGEILRLTGDKDVARSAEAMNFVRGSLWNESSAGTNAIGTALVQRHPIQVFAAEHFCEPVHPWTCSAAPILDPATREPLAVIDLTGLRETVHPHTLAAVVTAAQTVEHHLRQRLLQQQVYLVERFLDAITRNPRWELAAVDTSGSVLRAAPVFHHEGWIDNSGRLVGLPVANLTHHCPEGWEAEGRQGWRRFDLHPVYQGLQLVGALVRLVPPAGTVGQRTPGQRTPGANRPEPAQPCPFAHLLGTSAAIRAAIDKAAQYSTGNQPILIEGESGTGKELLAHAIHMASRRAMGPFIVVNAGAIPKELVASEFFGYEGGAFTGAASQGRTGKFEAAHGGTIFLDEIGEMPLDAQVYLLRVLEQGEVVRLGARTPVKVDVRVIAATNRNLALAVLQGSFRRDLYYRLNVLSIRMPPLRERPDDVPLLLQHYLQRACRDIGRAPPSLSPAALQRLMTYHWPGNVRELRNLAHRLAHTATGPSIELEDLLPALAPLPEETAPAERSPRLEPPAPPPHPAPLPHPPSISVSLPELERAAFEQAWARCSGHAAAVARALGISRATAYRKAQQYGLIRKT